MSPKLIEKRTRSLNTRERMGVGFIAAMAILSSGGAMYITFIRESDFRLAGLLLIMFVAGGFAAYVAFKGVFPEKPAFTRNPRVRIAFAVAWLLLGLSALYGALDAESVMGAVFPVLMGVSLLISGFGNLRRGIAEMRTQKPNASNL